MTKHLLLNLVSYFYIFNDIIMICLFIDTVNKIYIYNYFNEKEIIFLTKCMAIFLGNSCYGNVVLAINRVLVSVIFPFHTCQGADSTDCLAWYAALSLLLLWTTNVEIAAENGHL